MDRFRRDDDPVGDDPPLEVGDADGHEHRTAHRVDDGLDGVLEDDRARHCERDPDRDSDRAQRHAAGFTAPRRDPLPWTSDARSPVRVVEPLTEVHDDARTAEVRPLLASGRDNYT